MGLNFRGSDRRSLALKIDRRRVGPPLADRAQTPRQKVMRPTIPSPQPGHPLTFEWRASVLDHCSESRSTQGTVPLVATGS